MCRAPGRPRLPSGVGLPNRLSSLHHRPQTPVRSMVMIVAVDFLHVNDNGMLVSILHPPGLLLSGGQLELRRKILPRTPMHKAEPAAPVLRVPALTNRVVERRTRHINGEGECRWLPEPPLEGTTTSPIPSTVSWTS